MDTIAPHFAIAEFERHGKVPSHYLDNLNRLRRALELIRLRWSSPIKIVSGYRPEEYNRKLYEASQIRNNGKSGVAKNSAHLTAEAADIRVVPFEEKTIGARTTALHKMIWDMYTAGELPTLGGLGLYPTWVHVDVRKVGGRLRRWVGLGYASEQGASLET